MIRQVLMLWQHTEHRTVEAQFTATTATRRDATPRHPPQQSTGGVSPRNNGRVAKLAITSRARHFVQCIQTSNGKDVVLGRTSHTQKGAYTPSEDEQRVHLRLPFQQTLCFVVGTHIITSAMSIRLVGGASDCCRPKLHR